MERKKTRYDILSAYCIKDSRVIQEWSSKSRTRADQGAVLLTESLYILTALTVS